MIRRYLRKFIFICGENKKGNFRKKSEKIQIVPQIKNNEKIRNTLNSDCSTCQIKKLRTLTMAYYENCNKASILITE